MKKKNKNNIAFFIMVVCGLLATYNTFAQLQLTPYKKGSPAVPVSRNNMRTEAYTGDTLKFPFWDDFSKIDSTSQPLSTYWVDRGGVNVNNYFAIDQPTINVAVFDGTDKFGNPYASYVFQNGLGDSLCSRMIDLSGLKSDSNIYLSFYYQCGGKGEVPDSTDGDSLALSFKSNYEWETVWVKQGCGGRKIDLNDQNKFVFVSVKLDSAKHFKPDFQFKFRNSGKLSGAFDVWMIDYVYLNKDADKEFFVSDRAVTGLGRLLKDYTQIPFKHFYSLNSSDLINSNIDINMSSLSTAGNPGKAVLTLTDAKTEQEFFNFEANPFFGTGAMNVPVPVPVVGNVAITSSDTMQVLNLKGVAIDNAQAITEQQRGLEAGTLYKNDTIQTSVVLNKCYAYDDGVPEFSAAVGARGSAVAYKYVIPVKNAVLRGVSIHFSKNIKLVTGAAFTPYVWNSIDKNSSSGAGDVLYPLAGHEDTAIAYVSYPDQLYGFTDYYFRGAKPIVVSDSFYIGYSQNDYLDLQIGFDYDPVNSTSQGIYSSTGTGWLQFKEKPGNLMIRPIFGDFAPPGRQDDNGISDIKLGPSPTTGIVQVLNETIEDYRANDVTGKRVVVKLFTDPSGDKLDLSANDNGLYFVQLKVRGQWFNKKVIIIK